MDILVNMNMHEDAVIIIDAVGTILMVSQVCVFVCVYVCVYVCVCVCVCVCVRERERERERERSKSVV